MGAKYDFSGWATKNDIRCTDGRIIRRDAFKDQDGARVSLVYQHNHDSIDQVIGHADLENRPEGVYAYCSLNNTPSGQHAKEAIAHGDVASLSIWANHLFPRGSAEVQHGSIKEVSLVLAGANSGARVDSVMVHSDDGGYEESETESIIYSGESLELVHDDLEEEKEETKDSTLKHEDESESNRSPEEVIETMNEEQKDVLYALLGAAIGADELEQDDFEEEDETLKHNAFDSTNVENQDVISHDDMMAIIDDGKRYGSLKESALQHGIEDIDYLFPEPKTLNNPPDWIMRDQGWVSTVMNGVHHTPFSRIKSSFADITEDDARALGYIKGKFKKEETFSLLKRTTTPQTIYKKQKLDRDDIVDITDFDVVAWIKSEMRMMLNEEIARAILIGDGRLASSDDKIKEDNIRPIAFDAALYTIEAFIDDYAVNNLGDQNSVDTDARRFIRAAVKARKDYKGSGNPRLFTTQDMAADLRLIEDLNQRLMYSSDTELSSALRVSGITEVPVMDSVKDSDGNDILGIIVNLNDYNVGADRGGAVTMFDDFDIDYNAQKYLIETRISGALIKPFSAIVLKKKKA